MAPEYMSEFFDEHREGARNSAKVIVPLVLEQINPESLVDVGCGTGTWLSIFKDHGVTDVLGIDGDYVDRATLEVPATEFLAHDLTKPLRINRQFDLVVSLEVGEHLPAASAETFVDSLTQLGPVILFSAAIPFQGGTNHVNEQWPDYWVKLFETRGFVAIDSLRKHLWQNDTIEFWYAQNIMFFAQQDHLDSIGCLRLEREKTNSGQLSIVHPKPYSTLSEKHGETVLACDKSFSELQDAQTKGELYFAEAEKLKAETREHKAKAEQYIGEVADLKKETKEHKAKAEHYIEEAEKCKKETESQRSKAELFVAEVVDLKKETKEHKTKAEHYIKEAEKCKKEAESQRSKAEQYIAEVADLKKETKEHKAKAEHYIKEAEDHKAAAEHFIGEAEKFKAAAEPRNLALPQVLRALPAVVLGALKRKLNKSSQDPEDLLQ